MRRIGLAVILTLTALAGCLDVLDDPDDDLEPAPIFVEGKLTLGNEFDTASVDATITFRKPGSHWEPYSNGTAIMTARGAEGGPVFLYTYVDDALQPIENGAPVPLWDDDTTAFQWRGLDYEVVERSATRLELYRPAQDNFWEQTIVFDWVTAGTPTLDELSVEVRGVFSIHWQPENRLPTGTVVPGPFHGGYRAGSSAQSFTLGNNPSRSETFDKETGIPVTAILRLTCTAEGTWILNDNIRTNVYATLGSDEEWAASEPQDCSDGEGQFLMAEGCIGASGDIVTTAFGDQEDFDDVHVSALLRFTSPVDPPVTWDGSGWVETTACQ